MANSSFLRFVILVVKLRRAPKIHVLEGDWEPYSVTIIKFDNKAALMAWWDSPEYAPLKQMRLEGNKGDIIIVEE
jgi:uncharacterized protein (DUF1330 family)